MHSGTRWPALVRNVQYSGLRGHTANDGNHKLLTYLIELFCPINLLSDTADTRVGNEMFSLYTKMETVSRLFSSAQLFTVTLHVEVKDLVSEKISYLKKTLSYNIFHVEQIVELLT